MWYITLLNGSLVCHNHLEFLKSTAPKRSPDEHMGLFMMWLLVQLPCTTHTEPTVHTVQKISHLIDAVFAALGPESLLHKPDSPCSTEEQTHLTDAVFGAVGLHQSALNQLCTLTYSSKTLTVKPGSAQSFHSPSQAYTKSYLVNVPALSFSVITYDT